MHYKNFRRQKAQATNVGAEESHFIALETNSKLLISSSQSEDSIKKFLEKDRLKSLNYSCIEKKRQVSFCNETSKD